MFEYIGLNDIKDNIKKNIENYVQYNNENATVMNIIHLQIGSYMYPVNYNLNTPRNHEYPKIVELLHHNPDELIDHNILDEHQKLQINQISYMIDGAYLTSNSVNGYPAYLQTGLINKFPFGTSILHPVVVHDMISEENVDDLISYILDMRDHSIIINIMDFTSYVCKKLFVKNKSNKVHITFPSCMAIDNKMKYLPCIKEEVVSQIPPNIVPATFSWYNYKYDMYLLKNHNEVCIRLLDINFYYNLFNFLNANYLEFLLYNRLLGIYKLWCLMGYTNDNQLSDGTIVNFSKISYNQFNDLWKNNDEFRNMFLYKVDNYFSENIRCFIDYFIDKHCKKEEPQTNNDFINMLRIESYYILGLVADCKSKQKQQHLYKTIKSTIMKYTLAEILREEGVEL